MKNRMLFLSIVNYTSTIRVNRWRNKKRHAQMIIIGEKRNRNNYFTFSSMLIFKILQRRTHLFDNQFVKVHYY